MRTVFIRAGMAGALSFAAFFLSLTASGQKGIIDVYIDSAWQSNLVLQQKQVSLEKARQSLAIAKGYFLPELNFLAGYQTAGGGRNIELPLGTLLNEAYSTLNQLTGTSRFPQLEDQSVNFFPKNFHDAKLRTSMPILNPEIRHNRTLAEQQIGISELELDIYKRDLALEVKTAYYNYLSALRAVSIYENALLLAEEGLRVNQSLLDNGKGLPAYVLRAESEIATVKAAISAARLQADNAARYFNFLLNRPFGSTIHTLETVKDMPDGLLGVNVVDSNSSREELKAMQKLVSIRETVLSLRKSAFKPRLNGFLDLGTQSEGWKFNAQSRYYLFGLQLEMPLFTGQRNRNRIRQSELEKKEAELNLQQTSLQLQLTARQSQNNLLSAREQLGASEKQLESAASYQRLIERGYREGVNSFIETVDARNQLTQAQLQHTINQYKLLIAAAELERQTASYPIN